MKWSNREIARKCKVDHKTVGKIRSELIGEIKKDNTEDDNQIMTGEIPSYNPKKYKDRYKNVSVMDTLNIGQKSNTKDDDKIITGEKRNDNLNDYKNNDNINGTNKFTSVEITSEWRKGEAGIIVQRPDANSAIIEFSDGTRDIFNKSAFKETSTTVNELINQANQQFKHPRTYQAPKKTQSVLSSPIKLEEGNIVLINPKDRADDRLAIYSGSYAKVLSSAGEYSATIKIWGKEIDAVAQDDLELLEPGKPVPLKPIKPELYALLMDDFFDEEEALEYALTKKTEHLGFKDIFH